MQLTLTSAAFWIAAVLVGIMGYAIQRGATCTVAAVDELLTRRRADRLVAMIEASLWVAGGLVTAQALHMLPRMPTGYAFNGFTIVGAAALGICAFVNGACVFGAIARLGSGEWTYALTPVGFYVGCVAVDALFTPSTMMLAPSRVLGASMWLAAPFLAFMAWRIARPLLAQSTGMPTTLSERLRIALARRVWSPHGATAVIGITFFFVLMLAGAWAYTDALADLARGMARREGTRALLLIALLAGAFAGGYTVGRFRSRRITLAQLGKCFTGGVLMGVGSSTIPGSNDGLILIGMPLLWPSAWAAFATMCLSIAGAMLVSRFYSEAVATARGSTRAP